LDIVDHILADLVDAGNFYAFADSLSEYKGVFSVDIGAVRSQGSDRAKQYMLQALDRARKEGEKEFCVLRRFQLLAQDKEVDHAIMSVLSAPDGAAVLGLFQFQFEDEVRLDVLLPNLDILEAPIRPHSNVREYTSAVIASYYSGPWERMGFNLAGDALDTLFEVEPAVYVQGRRKTLPYLATELVQEVINDFDATTDGINAGLLWDHVLTARENLWQLQVDGSVGELARMLTQYVNTDSVMVKRIADEWLRKIEAVKSAYSDLQLLVEAPLPPRPIQITRHMINAALFGSNRYTFEFAKGFTSRLNRHFHSSAQAE